MTAVPTRFCRQTSSRMRRGACICLTLFSMAVHDAGHAITLDGTDPALERSVKAAFLYKFLGFVAWPDESTQAPTDPLTIGVLGAEDIATELEQIVPGRSVNGRPIEVRRLRQPYALSDINLLFVGRPSASRLPELKSSARRRSVLVVCEDTDIPGRTCAINFVLSQGRVRFEVSQQTAEDSGLKLSSRLLAVALQVDGRKRP